MFIEIELPGDSIFSEESAQTLIWKDRLEGSKINESGWVTWLSAAYVAALV